MVSGHTFEGGGETDVVPDQMLALDPSAYLNRHADRTKYVDTFLEGGDDDDPRLLVELSDIVDAMFLGAVAAHVVDNPARRDRDPVIGLLDALHAAEHLMIGLDLSINSHPDNAPQAAHVDGAVGKRCVTSGEYGRWHVARPTA